MRDFILTWPCPRCRESIGYRWRIADKAIPFPVEVAGGIFNEAMQQLQIRITVHENGHAIMDAAQESR